MSRSRAALCAAVAIAAVVLATGFGFAVREPPKTGEELLPSPLSRLVRQRYPAWHITTLDDLLSKDHELWLQSPYRKRDFPGVAVGHFERRDRLSYAVLLLTRDHGRTYDLLLLGSQTARGTWRVRVLQKKRQVANPSVIWKMPPGRYSSWDETKRIRIVLDGVVNEQIEASSVMYYRWKGKWRTIWLTD